MLHLKIKSIVWVLFIVSSCSSPNIQKNIEMPKLSAVDFYNQGILKHDAGNFDEALINFNKAIDMNIEYKDAYFHRALTKEKLNDLKGAVEDCTKAIAFDSNCVECFIHRGNVKNLLNDYKGAILDESMAIQINPKYSIAYNNRGKNKFQLKQYHEALQDFNMSIELNQTDSNSYFNRGLTKASLDDTAGACQDWNKASELGNTDAYDLINDNCDQWSKDSKYIYKFISNAEQYILKESEKDNTAIQIEYKKRKFNEEMEKINKSYKGKKFSIQAARLKDVNRKEIEEINQYGIQKIYNFILLKVGKNKANEIIKKYIANGKFTFEAIEIFLKNFSSSVDFYLEFISCAKCYNKSIEYQAEYEIPVPDVDVNENIMGYINGIKAPNFISINLSKEEIIPVEILKIFKNEKDVLNLEKNEISPLEGFIDQISFDVNWQRKITIVLKK